MNPLNSGEKKKSAKKPSGEVRLGLSLSLVFLFHRSEINTTRKRKHKRALVFCVYVRVQAPSSEKIATPMFLSQRALVAFEISPCASRHLATHTHERAQRN